MRVDSCGVNTPVSQKTSHHSARASALTARAVLDRHVVRPEKRRDDVDRLCLADTPNRPQQLQLGLEIQTVAALDFARGGAAREHLA
jgi:hypothetical protein